MTTIKEMEQVIKKQFMVLSGSEKRLILTSKEALVEYMFTRINDVNPGLIREFIEEYFHYEVMDAADGLTKDEALTEAHLQFMEDEIYKTDSVDFIDELIEELYEELTSNI